MKIFSYFIKLIDFVFYSREGLSGAIPPLYLHSTAINGAVAAALNSVPQIQPYISIDSKTTKRNNPLYDNSVLSHDFYFTPAKPVGAVKLTPEYVKGEQDGYTVSGYGGKVVKIKDTIRIQDTDHFIEIRQGGYEVLKYSKLFFIAPENEFTGFCLCADQLNLPYLIRLGSFRTPAKVFYYELKFEKIIHREIASHPVDPLASKVCRGVSITMFPYPVVDDALCEDLILSSDYAGRKFKIAIIDGMENELVIPAAKHIKSNQQTTFF